MKHRFRGFSSEFFLTDNSLVDRHLAQVGTVYLQRATRNRGVGQLAGNKLDLQVCCCSAGLHVILKAPPAVLQQREDVDDGQEKQAGASRAPGRLHLLTLYDLAPLCPT